MPCAAPVTMTVLSWRYVDGLGVVMALATASGGQEILTLRPGAGKPTAQQIEERSDIFGFLVRELKIALPESFGQK